MNYKKKIQEIELEINMINKYYVNQLKYLLKVIQIELDQL